MTLRRSSPLLVALCAALLAPGASAKAPAPPRASARPGEAPRSVAKPATAEMSREPAAPAAKPGRDGDARRPPATPRAQEKGAAPATGAAKPPARDAVKPATEPAADTPAAAKPDAARPGAGKRAAARRAEKRGATGSADDMSFKTGQERHADALDPPARREPPRACAAGLEGAGARQFERTRASLREFSWSDMARFFETSLDELEPQPTQVAGPQTLASDDAIRRSGLARKPLEALARARAVDLLSERELGKIHKALAAASPAAIRALLRADAPALRAHVWTWLATTPAGVCLLGQLDVAEIDAALRDRSVAVEHGEDLVFRPLADYALAARARLADADPQGFDRLLRALWDDATVDPRVRALVAGLRVRRGHADSIELGLLDPNAAIRGAVAAAALERDRERYEARILEHAAADPADLVTELVVGELLGGPDEAPRGALARATDLRIRAALARWRGRGDPMAPLPAPEHPLRFPSKKRAEQAHVAEDMPEQPAAEAAPAEPRGEPPAQEPRPEPAPRPAPAPEPARARERPAAGPQLPGVLDDPAESVPSP